MTSYKYGSLGERVVVSGIILAVSFGVGLFGATFNGGWVSADACPEDPTVACGVVPAFFFPVVGLIATVHVMFERNRSGEVEREP